MNGSAFSLPPAQTMARTRLLGIGTVFVAIAVIGLSYVIAGDPSVFLYVYPIGAALLAVALYITSRPLYMGYVFWVWFLTPFIRRVVDYQIGSFTEASPVMLAPYLVSLVAAMGLWTVLREGQTPLRRPLLFLLAGLAFSSVIGMVYFGAVNVAYSLVDWMAPLFLATLFLADWKQSPRYRDVIMTTLVGAMALLGTYGIYQYFVLPPWDKMWMIGADMSSVGSPIPMEFRAFGTLNAQGPFAMALMVGILGLLAAGSRGAVFSMMSRLAAVPAVVALALTQVRTAWGGLVIGVLYILLRTGAKNRRAILFYIIIAAIAVVPFFMLNSGVASGVGDRAGTLSELEDDSSFEARTQLYSNAPSFIAARPLGMGMGLMSSTGGGIDSGILTLFVVMGIPGALLYGAGIFGMFWYTFRTVRDGPTADRFAVVAAGVAFAMLSTILFSNQFAGMKGMFLWGFLGLALAATRYYSAARNQLQAPS